MEKENTLYEVLCGLRDSVMKILFNGFPMNKTFDNMVLFIAQGGFSGRMPVAPGTAGTERGGEPSCRSRPNRTSAPEEGVESPLVIPFDAPFELVNDGRYRLRLMLQDSALTLRAAVIASESSWDDGLPVRVDSRDYGGLYGSVVQELYWQDDQDDDFDGVPDKLQRIVASLDQADVLVITSNRQYGTIPRVTQRYPLSDAYYRLLIDCPEGQSVVACYGRGRPGEVTGSLGYELVEVFESNLRLGPFEVSDQLAEEAFTVYDHPKVLVFAKRADFDPERVRQLLAAVDLSRVVHVIPKEAGDPPPDLMLPADRLQRQRAGGTWSELFPSDGLLNRYPALATIGWWLLIIYCDAINVLYFLVI